MFHSWWGLREIAKRCRYAFVFTLFGVSASGDLEPPTAARSTKCAFKRIDARFEYLDLKEPSIITNGVAINEEYTQRDKIKELFSNTTLAFTSNPGLQSATSVLPNPWKMTGAEWFARVDKNDAPPYVFNWCYGECVFQLMKLATPFADLFPWSSQWFLVMGHQGKGIPPHVHSETWAAQLEGTKTWEVSNTGGIRAAWDDSQMTTKRCTQQKGEVVYLPGGWQHKTYNHGWSLAIGSQAGDHDVGRMIGQFYATTYYNNLAQVLVDLANVDRSSRGEAIGLVAGVASMYGHSAMLQGLYDFKKVHVQGSVVTAAGSCAALYGHVDTLKTLVRLGMRKLEPVIDAAARGGHIQAMSFLLELKGSATSQTFVKAATHGHVDMIKFLVESRSSSPKMHLDAAKTLQDMVDSCDINVNRAFAMYESHNIIMKMLTSS